MRDFTAMECGGLQGLIAVDIEQYCSSLGDIALNDEICAGVVAVSTCGCNCDVALLHAADLCGNHGSNRGIEEWAVGVGSCFDCAVEHLGRL